MPSIRASLPPRERDYDFTKVGTVGRRTGTTLAPRRLDEHGLEEVSGMFSSPRKPSPVKRGADIVESVEEVPEENTPKSHRIDPSKTPTTAVSALRSLQRASVPLLRSASPRKSGITGTARRSNIMNHPISTTQAPAAENEPTIATLKVSTPNTVGAIGASSARPATMRRRFSPDNTPAGSRALRGSKTAQVVRMSDIQPVTVDEDLDDEAEQTPSRVHTGANATNRGVAQDEPVQLIGDEESELPLITPRSTRQNPVVEHVSIASENEEEEDGTSQSIKPTESRQTKPAAANSRRKRRSSAIEDVAPTTPASIVKRRKTNNRAELESPVPIELPRQSIPKAKRVKNSASIAAKSRGRPPLQSKSNSTELSKKLEKQVRDVVEQIRARPGGATRTLHLLRRETPSDDTVTRTRTGRLSVKPLAYWRNEKIVFTNTGDDARIGLADDARFPLNTVGYVHRIDETVIQPPKKKSTTKKGKSNRKNNSSRANTNEPESDSENDDSHNDPDMADWELEPGTMPGEVAVWDAEHQVHADQTETVEIAHSAGVMETNEVKGSTFRFAKLLSTPFFGTGIVDLPPGGVKKVKNSRKMHMSFFVCTGRVTVEVGPPGGQETRFSIGKGGYWQVPRGNNYAVLNENGKDARLFFSQACEVPVITSDE